MTPVVPRDAARSPFAEVSTTVRVLERAPDTATTLGLDEREGSRTDPVSEPEFAVGRGDSVCSPADELGFDRPLFAREDARVDAMPETASSLPPPALDDFGAGAPSPLPPLPSLDDRELLDDEEDTSVYTGRVAEPPTVGLAEQTLASSEGSLLRRPTGPVWPDEPDTDERLVFPPGGSAAVPLSRLARGTGPREKAPSLSSGDSRGLYVARPRSREAVIAEAPPPPVFTPGIVDEPPPEALLPIAAPVPPARPRWLLWLLGSVLLGLVAGVAVGFTVKRLRREPSKPAAGTSAPAPTLRRAPTVAPGGTAPTRGF